ncbi:MAG: bile acid:sodium symporter family protein [Cyclobacteriaceae bacterium]
MFILASVAMAMSYPAYFISAGSFEFKALIVPLLQIIMFGMGSQMSLDDFSEVIKAPKAVFIGVVCQFTIMPIVAVLLTSAFNFPLEIAAGIILVGASPSGLASNVMSFLAKANIALSVTLTAVATLLAPLMTPLLMKLLAGQMIPIDFWKMMLGIMDIVILPIIAGLIFNALAYGQTEMKKVVKQVIIFSSIIVLKNVILYSQGEIMMDALLVKFLFNMLWFIVLPVIGGKIFYASTGGNRKIMDQVLALVSMIGIGVIISIITAAGRDSLMEIGLLLFAACFIHNMLGYTLGYWGCKLLGLDQRSCRTIALEVGMQNGGLASGIALQMGKVATVGLAPSVFGPLMNITGSSLATWWRGKPIEREEEEKLENEN